MQDFWYDDDFNQLLISAHKRPQNYDGFGSQSYLMSIIGLWKAENKDNKYRDYYF